MYDRYGGGVGGVVGGGVGRLPSQAVTVAVTCSDSRYSAFSSRASPPSERTVRPGQV